MRDVLYHLFSRFADGRPDRSLAGFEHAVLQGVARRREDIQAARAMAPVRVVSIGVALAIGVTTGGIAAASTLTQPPQVSPFSTAAHLAPSTLLEGE